MIPQTTHNRIVAPIVHKLGMEIFTKEELAKWPPHFKTTSTALLDTKYPFQLTNFVDEHVYQDFVKQVNFFLVLTQSASN